MHRRVQVRLQRSPHRVPVGKHRLRNPGGICRFGRGRFRAVQHRDQRLSARLAVSDIQHRKEQRYDRQVAVGEHPPDRYVPGIGEQQLAQVAVRLRVPEDVQHIVSPPCRAGAFSICRLQFRNRRLHRADRFVQRLPAQPLNRRRIGIPKGPVHVQHGNVGQGVCRVGCGPVAQTHRRHAIAGPFVEVLLNHFIAGCPQRLGCLLPGCGNANPQLAQVLPLNIRSCGNGKQPEKARRRQHPGKAAPQPAENPFYHIRSFPNNAPMRPCAIGPSHTLPPRRDRPLLLLYHKPPRISIVFSKSASGRQTICAKDTNRQKLTKRAFIPTQNVL